MYFLIYLSIIFLELYKLCLEFLHLDAIGILEGRLTCQSWSRLAQTPLQLRTPNEIFEAKTDANDIDKCKLANEGVLHKEYEDSGQSVSREHKTGKPSVWSVFGDVAEKSDGCNLGQGFPDWDPPRFMLDALRDAVNTPYHQYTRPAGHPPLVKNLAERYGKHMDRKIDPFSEVTVTVGASQALFLSLQTSARAW